MDFRLDTIIGKGKKFGFSILVRQLTFLPLYVQFVMCSGYLAEWTSLCVKRPPRPSASCQILPLSAGFLEAGPSVPRMRCPVRGVRTCLQKEGDSLIFDVSVAVDGAVSVPQIGYLASLTEWLVQIISHLGVLCTLPH